MSGLEATMYCHIPNTDIIGIKLGAANSVICTLTNKAVDVIFSDTSNRTIPSIISFTPNNRQYGDNAMDCLFKQISSTIISPSRWIGISNENAIKEEQKYFDYVPFKLYSPGQGYFTINNHQITPETLIGCFLHSLQAVWERAGKSTNEIVLSVPDYYNIVERMAMFNAVKVANLKCLSLLNESSAICLAYGTHHYKELDTTEEKLVGFVDMGEAKTTLFYGTFSKQKMSVNYCKSLRNLGGRNYDYLIMEHIAKDFFNKTNVDLLHNEKGKIKLMSAISKGRKILTVNSETLISIENIYQEHDLTFTLRQEEFKHITKQVNEEFKSLLIESIVESKIDVKQLHSIEMVSDVLRNPLFQETIREVYHLTLSKTLLNDECISRGCAMYNIMNSPYYSIRDFDLIQYSPHKIQLEFTVFNSKQGVFETKTETIIEEGGNYPIRNSYKIARGNLSNKQKFETKIIYSNRHNESFTQSYSISIPNYTSSEFILSFELYIDKNCFGWIDKADIIIAISNTQMTRVKCFVNQTESYPQLSHYILLKYITEEIKMELKDEKYIFALNKRNEIEALIYSFKDKINLSTKSPEEKLTFIKSLDKIEQLLYSNNNQANNFNFLNEKCIGLLDFGSLLDEKEISFRRDKSQLEMLIYEKINLLEKKRIELSPDQYISCKREIDNSIKELHNFERKFMSNEYMNGDIHLIKNQFTQAINQIIETKESD